MTASVGYWPEADSAEIAAAVVEAAELPGIETSAPEVLEATTAEVTETPAETPETEA